MGALRAFKALKVCRPRLPAGRLVTSAAALGSGLGRALSPPKEKVKQSRKVRSDFKYRRTQHRLCVPAGPSACTRVHRSPPERRRRRRWRWRIFSYCQHELRPSSCSGALGALPGCPDFAAAEQATSPTAPAQRRYTRGLFVRSRFTSST